MALVQTSAPLHFSNETTKNLSLTGVVAGNTIVVYVAVNSFAAARTITVNDGNSYPAIIEIPYQSNIARIGFYALQNVTSGSKTIVVTLNGVSYGHCIAQEHDSLATINTAVDIPLSPTGTSQTPATGTTAGLSTSTGLVLAAGAGSGDTWGGAANPANTGYTNILHDSLTYLPSSFDYKYVVTNTAVSANWGTATTINSPWGAIIAFIPLASAAGQPTSKRGGGIPFARGDSGLFLPQRW